MPISRHPIPFRRWYDPLNGLERSTERTACGIDEKVSIFLAAFSKRGAHFIQRIYNNLNFNCLFTRQGWSLTGVPFSLGGRWRVGRVDFAPPPLKPVRKSKKG
jgi:hypothetical protein